MLLSFFGDFNQLFADTSPVAITKKYYNPPFVTCKLLQMTISLVSSFWGKGTGIPLQA